MTVGDWSFRVRFVVTGGALVAYMLLFALLNHVVGAQSGALFLVPVVVAGVLLGQRAGILVAICAWPVNALLLIGDGLQGRAAVVASGGPGLLGLVAAGLLAGWLHEHFGRMTAQVHAHQHMAKTVVAALQVSQERYQRIVETAQEGIWVLDRTHRASFVNPALAAMLGYTVEEMVGRPLEQFTSHEGPLLGQEAQGRHCTGAYDLQFRRKDGAPLWALVSLSSVQDAHGEYAGSIWMVNDITERKRAEEQVARHVARLSTLRQIDMAITAGGGLQTTLRFILEQLTRQLDVDAGAVFVSNPSLRTLDLMADSGFRGGAARYVRLQYSDGHAGRAARERRFIVVHDLQDEPSDPHFLVGNEEFVSAIAVPLIAKGQVNGVLELFHRSMLVPDQEWLEFLEALAHQIAIAIDSGQLFEGLQRSAYQLAVAYDATLAGWSRALDLRDHETEGHSERVTGLTVQLARRMGLSEEALIHVRRGALLHDIGKMGIPDAILHKPGPLTEDEWTLMRRHPQYAYDLLRPIAYLQPALDIPYCHHEKWDGSGYPRGLRGEEIPLAARIFAVVDIWDALSSDRPYRSAWEPEQIRTHIASLAGTHLDPTVVTAFLACERSLTATEGDTRCRAQHVYDASAG